MKSITLETNNIDPSDFESEDIIISKASLSDNEHNTMDRLFNRHEPANDNDIFGRIDIKMLSMPKYMSKTWPSPVALMTNPSQEYMTNFYCGYSDRQIGQYYKVLADKHLILPSSSILSGPTIDMMYILQDTDSEKTDNSNDSDNADDDASRIRVTFTDEEKNLLQKFGWKVFVPPFDKTIIHTNKYRYIYVEKKNISENSMTFRVQIYNGAISSWLMNSALDIKMTMDTPTATGFPCHFEYENPVPYERFLSENIKLTKWTPQEKNLWTDVFDIPKSWSDVTLAELQLGKEKKSDKKYTMMLYNKTEAQLMRKIFGNDVRLISNKSDINKAASELLAKKILPEYLDTMGCIFIYLYKMQNKTPKHVVDKEKGVNAYIYENLALMSEKPFPENWINGKI